MSQQRSRIGFVPRNSELDAAMQLLELGYGGMHTYTHHEGSRYNSMDVQSVGSVGDFRSHSVGAQSVGSVGDVRSHSVGAQSVGSVGDFRSHSVGAQLVGSVGSVGDFRSHSVGAQSVGSVGDVRSHSVGAQSVGSVGDFRSHSVGAQSVGSVGSVGDFRSHSVGAQSVGSVGDFRSHSVGAQPVRSVGSVGDVRSHSVGAQSVGSIGSVVDIKSHSVGAQSGRSVGSVGDFRSHSVGAQSVRSVGSVGDFRSHSVGAQSVGSVGYFRSHSVGAQSVGSVGSVGDYRSQSVGVQSVPSVDDFRSQSVGDFRSQLVGVHSVPSVGDYRSHSVGVQSVPSVGDYRSHSVGVQSVGDFRLQPMPSAVTITTHSPQTHYPRNAEKHAYASPTSYALTQIGQQRQAQVHFSLSPQQPPLAYQMSRAPLQQQRPSPQVSSPLSHSSNQLSQAIVNLKQAEEDRFIAWRLIERMLASIALEGCDMEELRDQQESLVRANKRLEENTTKVELRQKKAGVPVEERLDTVERHEMQAMKVSSVLRKIEKKLKSDMSTPNTDANIKHTGIRLPKMELKTFDGNVRRWHEFWESFEHGVHNNTSLPDHQKLQYLKNCLRGAAFVTISDLDMKGDHYDVAVRLLKERYGHKNVLRKSHLDGLESLPAVSNSYDMEKLKRFYDELECHVKALAAIGVQPVEYATTMVPKIISKLPMEIRIKLTEGQEENEDLPVNELLEGLRKVIKVMEKCGVQMKAPSEHGKQFERKQHETSMSPPSRPLMASGATLMSTERRHRCEFCLGEHQAVACSKYETVSDREMVLRKYNRCYGCLKRGHMLKQCNSAKVCKKCNKDKHHETICGGTNEPTGVINTALSRSPTAAIAYQTVKAKLQPVNGGKSVTCRVLLDSGSARSFISEKLARRLGSKPVRGKQRQRFEGLNETVQELETESHVVRLTSLDSSYSNDIEVKTLPAITTIGNPAPLKLKQLYPHLKELFFTDVSQKRLLEVDMLLGSEHLAELQTGCIRKGERGEPVAVLTKLGWTLMGSTLTTPVIHKKVAEPSILIVDQMQVKGVVSNEDKCTVPLPCREDKHRVPANRRLTEGRFKDSPEILKGRITDENLSNFGMRGGPVVNLQKRKQWWKGRKSHKGKREDWPTRPEHLEPSKEQEAEVQEKAPTLMFKIEGSTQTRLQSDQEDKDSRSTYKKKHKKNCKCEGHSQHNFRRFNQEDHD